MGFDNCFFIVSIMFYLSQSRFIQGMDRRYDLDLLSDFIREYTYTNVVRPRTSILYHISLPSNFSGMEVSFERFRTKNFYSKKVNFSSFDIPQYTQPTPFVRRFDLICENFGNWSSYYFNVPNYTFASPVIGLFVYNATNPNKPKNSTLRLHTKDNPILVHFPRISLPEGKINDAMKCVRFGINGSVEITKMTLLNVCVAEQEGHFAVVFPSKFRKKRERLWVWWVVGFGVGVVGFVTLVILGVLMCNYVKRRGVVKMEKESERSEALGTTWVGGDTKMPSAHGVRTQPVLMEDFGP